MAVMEEVRKLVSGARGRLGSMRGSIDRLDKELAELEARRGKADPSEAWQINQRIRELSEQRAAGGEIVAEAERQAADASSKMIEATKAAVANMHGITARCRRAADRFDAAIADAVAAILELEAEGAPLEHVLIPRTMRREYTNWPAVNQAVQAGMRERMGRLGENLRAQTMREQIDLMCTAVHENASELKARNYAW